MRDSGRRSDAILRRGTCARSGRTRARSCLPHCLSNGAHTCTVGSRELRVGQRARGYPPARRTRPRINSCYRVVQHTTSQVDLTP